MSARMDVYVRPSTPNEDNKQTYSFSTLHEVICENNTIGYQMKCKAGREQNVRR